MYAASSTCARLRAYRQAGSAHWAPEPDVVLADVVLGQARPAGASMRSISRVPSAARQPKSCLCFAPAQFVFGLFIKTSADTTLEQKTDLFYYQTAGRFVDEQRGMGCQCVRFMVMLLLICATGGKCTAFEPVPDQPCFGQTPCLHTTASQRVSSGCMSKMWDGAWLNEDVATAKKSLIGKMFKMTPLGLSNRFISTSDVECDITDLLLLSPSAAVTKRLTDANERHLLARLQGLRGKVWLTIGTSVDHRSTRFCEFLFGKTHSFSDDDGLFFDFCVFERLNFTMMYTFQDGFSTTVSSRNATQQRLRFSKIHMTLNAHGWQPNFLTMAGVEWDFKHWVDAKAEPDFAAIRPTIQMHVHAARKEWPALSGLLLRTQYSSDGYTSNRGQVERYNRILHSFRSLDQSKPCESIYIADMAKLMRHNGSLSSGWTDGLHPSPWVTLQFVGLCVNALADLAELCSP